MKEFLIFLIKSLLKSIVVSIVIVLITLQAGTVLAAEEYYTVQAGSYADMQEAGRKFHLLEQGLAEEQLAYLRIELVKGYHTLRIGKFDSIGPARQLLDDAQTLFPGAIILQAYIKDERIKKIHQGRVSSTDQQSARGQAVGSDEAPSEKGKESVERAEEKVEAIARQQGQRPRPAEVEAGEEFYTVQAGSYPDMAGAERVYSKFEQRFSEEQREHLRIELVKGYHTLRVGKFSSINPAQRLLEQVRESFPGAITLKAYIKEERIKKIHQEPDQAVPASAAEAALIPEEVLPGVEKDSVAEEAVVSPESAEKPGSIPAEQESDGNIPAEPDERESGKVKYQINVKPVTIMTTDDQGVLLRNPGTVFYDRKAGEVFVINGGRSRIVVYDQGFLPQTSLGEGRAVVAVGGHISDDGKLYICQHRPSRLSIFNAAFFLEREIFFDNIEGAEGFMPNRIAIDHRGNIYLVGGISSNKGILVLDQQGVFLRWLELPPLAEEKGKQLQRMKAGSREVAVTDVVIDRDGRIYVLSDQVSKIFVYNSDFELLFSFGEGGGKAGKLSRPQAIALDEVKEFIYVMDYMRHAILIYDYSGKYLYEFGGRGFGPGWFNFPNDIEIGRNGQVIVADFFNNRIQVLDVLVEAKIN